MNVEQEGLEMGEKRGSGKLLPAGNMSTGSYQFGSNPDSGSRSGLGQFNDSWMDPTEAETGY